MLVRLLRVVAATLTLCAAAAAAPLQNGNFETGDFTGWTDVGGTYVVSAGDAYASPPEGLYMARLGLDTDPGDYWIVNHLNQSFDLTMGPLLSFDYNVFSWDIAPYDDPGFLVLANGTDILRVAAPVDNPGPDPYSTGWTSFQYDLSGFGEPVEVAFYAGNSGPGGGLTDQWFQTWAYVDNVQVTPEPSCLALLAASGVGAIVLRRRRRR